MTETLKNSIEKQNKKDGDWRFFFVGMLIGCIIMGLINYISL